MVVVVHILVVVLVHMVVITDDGTYIGSGIVYGRGFPVDGGSNGGADGSGHLGYEVYCLGWCR